jgi:hypothetical protein
MVTIGVYLTACVVLPLWRRIIESESETGRRILTEDGMSDIIKLPANPIGREDREKLEGFGGHTIGHGRATRWHWDTDAGGSDVFEIYRGGADERLAARISRERTLDAYCAHDAEHRLLASGTLEHVLAELEVHFARLHDELPDPAA